MYSLLLVKCANREVCIPREGRMTAICEEFLPVKEIGIGRPKILTIIINTSAFAPKCWASASRQMAPASVFLHPASQSGTVAFRYLTGVPLLRYRTVRDPALKKKLRFSHSFCDYQLILF